MIVVNYPSSVLETLPREFLSFMYKVTKPKPKLYRQPDQGETIEKSFLLQLPVRVHAGQGGPIHQQRVFDTQ